MRCIDKTKGISPSINDIVNVRDVKQPRQQWLLGRIVKLLPSSDGEIRGAKVKLGKTKNVIQRPVNRWFPMEAHVDSFKKTKDIIGKQRDENTNKNETTENVIINNAVASNSHDEETPARRSKRSAANLAAMKIRQMSNN